MAYREIDSRGIQSFLDGLESRFLDEIVSFVLSESYLKNIVSELKTPTNKNNSKRKEIISKILEAHMLQGFVGGFEHAQKELEEIKKTGKGFAEVEVSPSESVVPEEAVSWYASYSLILAGILDQDVLDKVQSIIGEAIEEGLHWKDIVKQLQNSKEFRSFTEHRLKTIALTEGTKAYNNGRLEQFKSNRDFVEAVQYSAVLDKRTTPLCRALHGKIIPMDSGMVEVYLPPNHFNCRSIIIPITKYDNWNASDLSNIPKPEKGFDNPRWRPE